MFVFEQPVKVIEGGRRRRRTTRTTKKNFLLLFVVSLFPATSCMPSGAHPFHIFMVGCHSHSIVTRACQSDEVIKGWKKKNASCIKSRMKPFFILCNKKR